MKVLQKISECVKDDKFFYSFEYFPPKTDAGSANLLARIERMGQLRPLFIDVTWGAGGKTSDRTLLISSGSQNSMGLETMMHMTCTNQTVEEVIANLQRAKKEGIQNILALRGDAPVGHDTWVARDESLQNATDMVKLIRKEFGDFFGIAVAGYPYGHPEAVSYEEDLIHLKEKVDAGADFIVTQIFFDCGDYFQYVNDCRKIGITCPILPGLFVIQGYASLRHLSKMSSTPIPANLLADVEAIKNDDAAIRDYGIKKGVEMVNQLKAGGAQGVHFFTLNREHSVIRILEDLNMVRVDENGYDSPRELPWKQSANCRRDKEQVRPIFWANRQKSYLIRTRLWDEFPNGRWGDSTSPAFDELSEYHLFAIEKQHPKRSLRSMWGGAPTSVQDIYSTFARYCGSEIERLPWIDEALAPETSYIRDNLVKMNLFGILTINSQPRVNGARSDDRLVGWGPSGGYVYQKAYIEFFLSPGHIEMIMPLLKNHPSISYHAITVGGHTLTNNESGSVTAVTWGVFPGKEIVQPTVVDPQSFIHWKDEAFRLWLTKWQRLYPTDSPSSKLIQNIHDTYYLVNMVDNDFVGGNIFGVFDELMAKLQEQGQTGQLTPITPTPPEYEADDEVIGAD